jgi:hypothetical protein
MPRYIDADALKLDIDLSKGASVLDMAISVIKAVKEAPTADVVPKSEVEELIKSVDDMLDLVCAMTGLELTYLGKYAELKKKYTEGKDEES